MKTKPYLDLRKIENDSSLLFWFAMILMAVVFGMTFFSKPALLNPRILVPYVVMFAGHIFLHFKMIWVEKHRRWLASYAIVQGLLAFGVVYLSGNVGMVFCLFMALIGELLAIFKITLAGILMAVYMLCLAFLNFTLMLGIGQARWFALATIPTVVFVGIYVILYTRQAEANAKAKELLAKLEAANHQLSDYAAQVEDLTLASERQRMARELHDTLSQGLAGLILQLEAVDAHLAGQRQERARAILKQSMEKARGTLAEARQAIDNLRQPLARTLEEMVQQESDHFTKSTGIPCEVKLDMDVEVPEAVADAAEKVVSESLTNIARHAQARNVTLYIAEEDRQLVVEIIDDGAGFDPEAVQAGHYGLLGMRERVRLAGGNMEIRSLAGQGTRILVHFPLGETAEAPSSGRQAGQAG